MTNTITRWIVPCYFSSSDQKINPIAFDLTEHLKLFLKNGVWNRKFSYGYPSGLESTNANDIVKATATVHPRFFSGLFHEKRVCELIEDQFGAIPEHLDVGSYRKWDARFGICVIEIIYTNQDVVLPTKSDLTSEYIPIYHSTLIPAYNRYKSIVKELGAFFIAGLHLSFPTISFMMPSDSPINDGFLQLKNKHRVYAARLATDSFMHEILLEKEKLSNVIHNLEGLAKVWHYNLWPLKRYLVAVETDQLSMDYLLDLIYALEGLFERNASTDFIKITCITCLCSSKEEARGLKELLDLAFRIRNEIAHGEKSYDSYEKVKYQGKLISAQEIYWKMKAIVALMIVKAIGKLLGDKEMRNLRFNSDDLIQSLFSK